VGIRRRSTGRLGAHHRRRDDELTRAGSPAEVRDADLRQPDPLSVIGYILVCDMCNAKMLVTADAKHGKFCPDCLDQYIQEAIEDAIENEQ